MSLDYRVESLHPSHYPALSTLFQKVFERKFSIAKISAKFETENLGKASVGKLAFAPDGALVSFFGIIPSQFSYQGKTFWGGQAVDIMTDPGHQRQKLFHNLGLLSQKEAKNSGYDFLFSFPNSNLRPALKNALGWQTVQRFLCHEFIGKERPWTGIFGKDEEEGTEFPQEAQFLGSHLKNSLHGIRNGELFQYKRRPADCRVIRLDHGWAWIRLDRNLQIGDMAPDSQSQAAKLVKDLLDFGRIRGVQKYYFQSSPFPRGVQIFGKAWRPIKTWQILALPLMENIPLDKLFLTLADWDGF